MPISPKRCVFFRSHSALGVSLSDVDQHLQLSGTEWALIFGLCRYAGFRCPTEVVGLQWSDVHWERAVTEPNDTARVGGVTGGVISANQDAAREITTQKKPCKSDY